MMIKWPCPLNPCTPTVIKERLQLAALIALLTGQSRTERWFIRLATLKGACKRILITRTDIFLIRLVPHRVEVGTPTVIMQAPLGRGHERRSQVRRHPLRYHW